MRTTFPWIPVYTTLYFDADPAWHFREAFGSEHRSFDIYPSASYIELLSHARKVVIAPPPKLRPVTASSLDDYLNPLVRDFERSTPTDPIHEAIWSLARDGVEKARSLSRARLRNAP